MTDTKGTGNFVPLEHYRSYPEPEMLRRARWFRKELARRRTVRDYAGDPVPREVVEECIRAAGTAPSGANQQPWHFVLVGDPDVKRRIREGAEHEEREFYAGRASDEWLAALEPLGTDENKPFLEHAPYLIVVFTRGFDVLEDGSKAKNYYATESVGLATGMLIAGLHHAGLATLTHTPSPMKFLNRIVGRPDHERPFLILVVGYPAEGARVPAKALDKKCLDEICTVLE